MPYTRIHLHIPSLSALESHLIFAKTYSCTISVCGRDSSVGIATRYGLDGPGIELWWGRDFPHPYRPALRPTQPPIQWVPGGSFSGVKRSGRGVDHPPLSSAEVDGRVALYICYRSGPSLTVIRWPLPLPLPYSFCISSLLQIKPQSSLPSQCLQLLNY